MSSARYFLDEDPLSVQYSIAQENIDWNSTKALGEGTFSTVYSIKIAQLEGYSTQKKVAAKFIDSNAFNKGLFSNENKIMQNLNAFDDEHVLKYFGYYRSGTRYQNFIVMEYMANGNLEDYIKKKSVPDWKTCYTFMRDITYGIKLLHDLNYVHRDVKSANILINANLQAKIGDFGSAGAIDLSMPTVELVGTIGYAAPEILEQAPYSEKADIYSTAVIMWELALWKTYSTQYPEVAANFDPDIVDFAKSKPPIPDIALLPNKASKVAHLISLGFNINPVDRPKACELLDELESSDASIFALSPHGRGSSGV